MTGICGIRPAEGNRLVIHPLGTSLDWFSAEDVGYHGHRLDIRWDKSAGLSVLVDGTQAYTCGVDGDVGVEIILD